LKIKIKSEKNSMDGFLEKAAFNLNYIKIPLFTVNLDSKASFYWEKL